MNSAHSELHELLKSIATRSHNYVHQMLTSCLGKLRSDSDLEKKIPGFFFAFCPSDYNKELSIKIFGLCVDLVEKISDEADLILIVEIIVQISSFNLKFFVEEMIDKLFINGNIKLMKVAVDVIHEILDPATGFLRFASIQPKNLNNIDFGKSFDFFNEESEDLKTDFGMAIIKLRNIVINKAKIIFEKHPKKVSFNLNPTTFVPNILYSCQSTVVKPVYKKNNISCGFTEKLDAMIALYDIYNHGVFILKKQYDPSNFMENVESWSNYYSRYTDIEFFNFKPNIEFEVEQSYGDEYVDLKLIYLLLYTHFPNVVSFEDTYGILCDILTASPVISAFKIVWIQSMNLLYPKFASLIFEAVFKISDAFFSLSFPQQHTFIHAISRFLDSISCFSESIMSKNQLHRINTIGLLGLCHVQPHIRHATLKLISVLSKLTENQNTLCRFIFTNAKIYPSLIEKRLNNHLYKLLEKKKQISKPITNLVFEDVCNSRCITLWQLMISVFGEADFTDYYLRDGIEDFQQFVNIIFRKDFTTNNSKNHFRIYCMNICTCLCSFSTDNDVINNVLDSIEELYDNYPTNCYLIVLSIPPSKHDIVLEYLLDHPRATTLKVILCHPKTVKNIFLSENFNSNVITLLNKLIQPLIEKRILIKDDYNAQNFTMYYQEYSNVVNQYEKQSNKEIYDILACIYRFYKLLEEKYFVEPFTPFPCCSYYINSKNSQKGLEYLFNILINLTLVSGNDKLHFLSVYALSIYFAVNNVKDLNYIQSDSFLQLMVEYSTISRGLLLNLLIHHFVTLFPKYLKLSLKPNGQPFMQAICQFFRRSNRPNLLDVDILLRDQQWNHFKNLTYNSKYEKYISIIYENAGILILATLVNICKITKNFSDDLFLMIATLAPMILLIHSEGSTEGLSNLFIEFNQMSKNFGKLIDFSVSRKLSKLLSLRFKFCAEQLLYYALTELTSFQSHLYEHILSVLLPWFELINFDIENRVLLKDSELKFMMFSCVSFIEILFNSFQSYHDTFDNFSSPLYMVWRTLVMTKDKPNSNFDPILIILMSFATDEKFNNNSLISLIRYFYHLSPVHVANIIVSKLKFTSYYFNNFKNTFKKNGESLESQIYSRESKSFDCSNENEDIYVFLIKLVCLMCQDSIRPILPFLPIIFVFSCVFIDIYFEYILDLLPIITTELEKCTDGNSLAKLIELKRIINLIPTTYNSFSLDLDIKRSVSVMDIESIPGTNRYEISQAVFSFLNEYDEKMSNEFGMELLRWCLCCGDLQRSGIIWPCLAGNPLMNNITVIGLVARALSYVTASQLYLNDIDTKPISLYISKLLYVLKRVIQDSLNNSNSVPELAILWIGIECLKFNTTYWYSVFSEAVTIINLFLSRPQLFEVLAKNVPYNGTQFTKSTFWKFHQHWTCKFEGFAKYIFESSPNNENLDESIILLNRLVQCQFSILFSTSKEWYYTALLSLLPWIWCVLSIDFNSSSPNSMMAQNTILSFIQLIEDEKITNLLKKLLKKGTYDIYCLMINLCSYASKNMDVLEGKSLCSFYAKCLYSGNRYMRIPLYSLMAEIVKNQPSFIEYLGLFTSLAKEENKQEIIQYAEIYLNNIKDMPIPIIEEEKQQTFDTKYFDRIVLVLIPQYDDGNIIDDEIEKMDDLNTFPPLIPWDFRLEYYPQFKNSIEQLLEVRIEPFCSWIKMLNKMRTSIKDAKTNTQLQKNVNIKYQTIFQQILYSCKVNRWLINNEKSNDPKNNKVNHCKRKLPTIKIIQPKKFIPTLGEINNIMKDWEIQF